MPASRLATRRALELVVGNAGFSRALKLASGGDAIIADAPRVRRAEGRA